MPPPMTAMGSAAALGLEGEVATKRREEAQKNQVTERGGRVIWMVGGGAGGGVTERTIDHKRAQKAQKRRTWMLSVG